LPIAQKQISNAMPTNCTIPFRIVGFIETIDCLLVSNLPEGPEWTYEIKPDGYRLPYAPRVNEGLRKRKKGPLHICKKGPLHICKKGPLHILGCGNRQEWTHKVKFSSQFRSQCEFGGAHLRVAFPIKRELLLSYCSAGTSSAREGGRGTK